MIRYRMGAEELIELGRPVPIARDRSSLVLMELGRGPVRPPAARRPFFSSIGQAAPQARTCPVALTATLGLAAAAYLVALAV